MSAVPSATPQEVGFGSGVDAAPTASARLSTSNPLPICTVNSTSDKLTCVKPFAEKLYATADAGLGDYALTNGIDASFTVTAMVNGNPAHSATPTAANIEDATLTVTLSSRRRQPRRWRA